MEYCYKHLIQSVSAINEVIKNFVGGIVSDKIQDVVDAYEHALLGMYPRARYVVGKDAKLVWLPIQAMPEWLGDGLLRLLAKNRPIPKALKKWIDRDCA